MGPCVEVWAADSVPPEFDGDDVFPNGFRRARYALRAWEAAVDEWAWSTGFAGEKRPASNARNLARTRRPWSREDLIREGRGDLADYYENGGERPGRSGEK